MAATSCPQIQEMPESCLNPGMLDLSLPTTFDAKEVLFLSLGQYKIYVLHREMIIAGREVDPRDGSWDEGSRELF